MKLRIYRNSLRFRLSPADVAKLAGSGSIREITRFGGGQEFLCSLNVRAGIEAIQAVLSSNGISVEVPAGVAREWSKSETVGLHYSQPLGDGGSLEIAIEKDFECSDGSSEGPKEELYPNPKKTCD
jgi:hypothetical protein